MKVLRQRRAQKRSTGDVHRYERSPFLIGYWLGPITVIENYLKREKLAVEGLVCDLLSFCDKPRTLKEVYGQFPQRKRKELQATLRSMARYGLVRTPTGQATAEERWDRWKSWSPGASFFHFSTKDVKYARGDVDDFRRLRELASETPLPARKRAKPDAKRIEFAGVDAGEQGEFVRVLDTRRTWREFSKQPVERWQLADLLRLSFGVQGWAKIAGVGRLPLKTSPSGGALHPLEAYLAIRNVRGIEPGLYRYDAEGHGLELLRVGIGKRELGAMLARQDWFCDAAALVFLTAVFSRTQWKYDFARAYRVVLAEAGHVCQTFCLTATWLGLAPFCTMAFADSKIEKALRVDGVDESVVYVMGVGTRPGRAAMAERLRDNNNRWRPVGSIF